MVNHEYFGYTYIMYIGFKVSGQHKMVLILLSLDSLFLSL